MSKRILVTGATGLIGCRLVQKLSSAGHEVVAISRDAKRAERLLGTQVTCFAWNHLKEPFPAQALNGVSAVFHLMGENIGQGRWTKAKKEALRNSRIDSTRRLIEALPEEATDFFCASAIGIYPGVGDKAWSEFDEVPSPSSFMTELCADWEHEAQQAANANRRCVSLRTGLVLARGGMLAPLVPLYRLGLGGPIGDGKQYMPWIHLDDAISALLFLLDERELSGPINIVGPAPVSLNAFSETLAQVLGRPHLFRVPAWVMKLVLGEASALILSSYNVLPKRLRESGFQFAYSNHRDALEAVIRDEY